MIEKVLGPARADPGRRAPQSFAESGHVHGPRQVHAQQGHRPVALVDGPLELAAHRRVTGPDLVDRHPLEHGAHPAQ